MYFKNIFNHFLNITDINVIYNIYHVFYVIKIININDIYKFIYKDLRRKCTFDANFGDGFASKVHFRRKSWRRVCVESALSTQMHEPQFPDGTCLRKST